MTPGGSVSTTIIVDGERCRLIPEPFGPDIKVSREAWDRVLQRNRRFRRLLVDLGDFLARPGCERLDRRSAMVARIREVTDE